MQTEQEAVKLMPAVSREILDLVNKYVPDIQDEDGRYIRANIFNTIQTMLMPYQMRPK